MRGSRYDAVGMRVLCHVCVRATVQMKALVSDRPKERDSRAGGTLPNSTHTHTSAHSVCLRTTNRATLKEAYGMGSRALAYTHTRTYFSHR